MTQTRDAENRFRREIANDLRMLAMLHDREPAPELIEGLRSVPCKDWFGMTLSSETALKGVQVMDAALEALPDPVSGAACDELAVDFSNIYLLHSYRVTPTESPWLDEDHLERQGPMFSIADWYRHHGLAAQDRQKRSDDHLVLQLQFVGHLMEKAEGIDGLREVASFMDAHILKWIGTFSERVAARCQTPYYAGLVMLTNGYLEELRELLAGLADTPRPEPKDEEGVEDKKRKEAPAPAPYIPGIAPSW